MEANEEGDSEIGEEEALQRWWRVGEAMAEGGGGWFGKNQRKTLDILERETLTRIEKIINKKKSRNLKRKKKYKGNQISSWCFKATKYWLPILYFVIECMDKIRCPSTDK